MKSWVLLIFAVALLCIVILMQCFHGSPGREKVHPLPVMAPLVSGGKPAAIIVRNTEGGRVVALAVEELRDHIEAITGVKLPVVSAAEWKREAGETALIVGHGDLLKELGADLGELPCEGFRILPLPARRVLVLAGRDSGNPLGKAAPSNRDQEFGSLYAVYELLEYWGVRWFFPGELGTVIPRRDTLDVPILDRVDGPDFKMRNFWLGAQVPMNWPPQSLWTPEQQQQYDHWQRELRLWALRNRAGNSTSAYHTRHHAPNWWTLWSKTHPEYLGLCDGVRGFRAQPERSKLCVSNPKTAEAVAELAKQGFRKGGEQLSYSICEQDGSGGFCSCEACRAWDVESERRGGQPSLSDRYVQFWNRVAESVAKEFPDRYVGVYLYDRYQEPPRNVAALHPNVRPILVHNYVADGDLFRRLIKGWQEKTKVPLGLYTTPLPGAYGMNLFSYPWLSLDAFAEGMRYFRDHNIAGFRGTDYAINDNWIAAAPMHHLVGCLTWNADADPMEILDDFCEKLFGPAAGPMRDYFLALEEWQSRRPSLPVADRAPLAENEDNDGEAKQVWAIDLDHWLAEWSPARVATLRQHLERAWKVAASREVEERVALFQKAIRFVELDVCATRAYRAYQQERIPENWARLQAAARERRDFLSALPPWSGVIASGGLEREAVGRGYEVNVDNPLQVFRDTFAGGTTDAWRSRPGFDAVAHSNEAADRFFVRGRADRAAILMDRRAPVVGGKSYAIAIRWRAMPPAGLQVRVVGNGTLMSRSLAAPDGNAWRQDEVVFTAPDGLDRVGIYLNITVPGDYAGAPLEVGIDDVTMSEQATIEK